MKAIQAYKTTDGKVFEDMLKAKEHQNNLNLKHDLNVFLSSQDTSMRVGDEFIDLIIDNKYRLLDILKTNTK